MNLVIVESPTKAKTIGRYLGKDYEIKATIGHVMDLPKSTLGVDVEHEFAPQYEVIKDKQQIISELKQAAKTASLIILATDPDREGEAIAYHVQDVISSSSKFKVQSSKFQRIVFHEITKEAIEEALKNPRSIDNNLVDAQTARRVLDRLVGYKLSPLLWRKVRRGLSAGRVQSIALRLIVEREREIEKFKKEEYFTLHVILNRQLAVKDLKTDFELIEINGEKIELQTSFQLYDGEYSVSKTTISDQQKADAIVEDLKTKKFIVSDVLQKETRRSPLPPFTTSTLQQEAARRLGFYGKRTMSAAQKLYEEGYITYHRTDSVNVATKAIFAMRDFVKKEYGEKFLPESPRFYKTKQKLAQEAHEAIRPTHVGELQSQISNLKSQIGNDAVKLYELIWRRAVASQMADAIIESTTVVVDAGPAARQPHAFPTRLTRRGPPRGAPRLASPAYTLKANGSVLVFEGFLKANSQQLQDKKLPDFKSSDLLNLIDTLAEKHETPPPPRYNDASLIKTLEEKGIGRPSTYAAIISTIEIRRYIERLEGRFNPTSIGIAVNDFLVKNFSNIDDIPFTASMEDELDNIAHGKREWVPMIKEFYTPFEKKVEEVGEEAKRVKIEVEKIDEKCPECGSQLVIRLGRFGKFISCGAFPKCKFSKPFVEETGLICPKDRGLPAGRQGRVIVKKTRKGRKFFGCSNYPACDFAAWKLEDIKTTP
ncbi:MAG: type I DNA topoisomerase [bacterium]|nr:type I DNA topoisomerase [bacterium]